MLIEEAGWIGETIRRHFKKDDYPLLNIGSSTAHFRESVQPHIHQSVFLPIQDEKNEVIHLDIKQSDGVDLVGDLNNGEFRESLRQLGIRSVLCSNLLEHLEHPKVICESILNVLPKGGLIVVTVPYEFPFHKDPIDTLLRPDVMELQKFFPGTSLLDSAIIKSHKSYAYDLRRNTRYFSIMVVRLLLPFYKFSEWRLILKDFARANRKYSATCLLLRKE
jgi:hypothetical protein